MGYVNKVKKKKKEEPIHFLFLWVLFGSGGESFIVALMTY